jgi:CubicO group peptidase (beta-lactamase class C family)
MTPAIPRVCRWMPVLVVAWSGGSAWAEPPAFPAATPESQGVPAAALRQLADEVAGYVKDGTTVGAELLVIKNRKTIVHEVFGDRDRDDKLPMRRDTIFNIRSMTKPLTGAAVQILADEGKLRLDDPVAKYLPGFDNDRSRDITVEQLLQHRGGLPLTIITRKLDEYKDLQAQAKAVGEKGPQFKPGEKFWYSDAGSDAAAAVVERVAGLSIDRFITERILEPLGMADTCYLTTADDPRKERVASLYLGSPGKWTRFWKPADPPMYPFAWGSQTLYATPSDYARFLALWLDGGRAGGKRVLSKEAVARTLTPTSAMTTLGSGAPYPTGFFGMRTYYGQMAMVYAVGDTPGTAKTVAIGHGGSDGTGAWAFPADDLIVCYFTQSRGQATTIRLETTIQELLPRRDGGTVPDELKPYLGPYYANFGPYKDAPFRVVFRHGKLALDIPNQLVFELKEPNKDGRRQFVQSEKVAVSFKADAGGKVVALLLHESGATREIPRDKPTPEPKK